MDGLALLSVWVFVTVQLSPARNNLACWDLACSLPSSIQLDATALWASSSGSFLVTVQIGLEEAELIVEMLYVRSWLALSPIHYGTMSLLVPQTLQ
jgi:hypothetical protein